MAKKESIEMMKKNGYDWALELPCGVTVCDKDATIIYINNRAAKTFAKYGDSLVGHSLYEFHGDRAKGMIDQMLEKDQTNSYTIQKEGLKKLIHQMPWYNNGVVAGLVELSIVIPFEMPHYIR